MNNNAQIIIDADKCLKDGICAEVCPCGIFRPDEIGLAQVVAEIAPTCTRCGHCIAICPGNAISLNGTDGDKLDSVSEKIPGFAEFSDLVKSRRSIRSFKKDLIEVSELKKLLDLTRWAPTAKNTQNLSWLILHGQEKVQKLSKAVIDVFRADERMAALVAAFDDGHDIINRNAPQVAIVHAHEKYKWGTLDGAIAINTLELACKASNIGSCWGGFSTMAASLNKSVGKSIGLDDDQSILGTLMIGKANFRYGKIPQRNELKLKII